MIQIRDLTVRYGSKTALKNVGLDLQDGEILAVLGPNGSGKSTFIRALSGTLQSTGSIRESGQDLNSLSSLERARLIAVVPQVTNMPPAFTAWETVLLGRTPYLNFLGQVSAKDENIARMALERVDALELAERRVGELSGGEQQRVLLARALAQSTPVLLLDEPTSHLDIQHQMGLLDLVRQLSREDGSTVLLALHDLNLAARYADRIALLVDGEIKAIGAPKEVLLPELISEIYHWPVQVVDHPFLDTLLVLPGGRSTKGS